MKVSEKFRFTIDWAAEEDPSVDLTPLYENKHEALLLFGRGLRGGIDRRAQLSSRDSPLQARFTEGQPPPMAAPVGDTSTSSTRSAARPSISMISPSNFRRISYGFSHFGL